MTEPLSNGADRLDKARHWGRRITLTLVIVPPLLALPNFIGCVLHARVDSEVGVMMYGLPVLIGLMIGTPIVGLTTFIWWLGLRSARKAGASIPAWERWCLRGIAGMLLVIVGLFSVQ